MSNSKTEQLYGRQGSTAQTTGLKKFATLSPYLAQIEKRKKARSVLRENRLKNKNQSSSKSFRIKEKSSNSLKSNSKRQLNNKTIQNIIHKINIRKQGESGHNNSITDKDKSRQYNPGSTCTIKSVASRTNSRNDALQIKEKKAYKDASFRKNKYETKSRNQVLTENNKNKHTIQVSKYGKTNSSSGYTDTNRTQREEEPNMYAVDKKKFRRGKYEVMYSSVNSNEINQQKTNQPSKSQSRLQFSKKESTLSINREIDLVAEKQMQNFYRQMRSKQIKKSLQKSSQNYFKHNSTYRFVKTNNDIEIFVSTVKNPSLNRQSNASTLNTSEKHQGQTSTIQRMKQNNYINYDFDFKDTEIQISGIEEIENPSEEDSLQIEQQSDFEKQRKLVQKQYFHKKSPNIDWSEQDCQIDEV